MSKIRILCYGDSNTWGYISGSDHQRFGDKERWPRVLANLLGENYEIIEEGLNARTLISNDPRPEKYGKNGYEYLIPCLDSHDPLDLVILLLGTNELKSVYNRTPEEIGEIYEKYFVNTIINRKSQVTNIAPKLLIVAPPLVNEEAEHCKNDPTYKDAGEKSEKLCDIYKSIAEKYNCYFLDNDGLETGIDGLHLTKEGQKTLGENLYKIVKEIF